MADWLRALQELWLKRIREAEEAQRLQFRNEADRMWEQYEAKLDEYPVWILDEASPYRLRPFHLNKFQEFVSLYLPFVLSTTPVRRVSVRRPHFPEDILQQAMEVAGSTYAQWDKRTRIALETAAQLLEWWLQYCSDEYGLLREARLAVIEALVKGRGLLWHGHIQSSTGLVPASLFESVDNLYIDPSATTLREAAYVIRRRRTAAWLLAEHLGVDEERLIEKCTRTIDLRDRVWQADLPIIEYYEVYSRIGAGTRLAYPDDQLREWQDALDELGPYIWLVIAQDAEYPLNLDPDLLQGSVDRLRQAVEWPVPTYGDSVHPWPFSVLDFLPHTNSPWARSPLAPGYPIQQAINELYYYIVEKARRSARMVLVVPSYVDSALIDALNTDESFVVVPIDQKQATDLTQQLAQPITLPPISMDLWNILKDMEQQFAKAVGLDPGLYGAQPPTQPRSAAEVQIRQQAASGRANAMAERVEDWMSRVAMKEGMLSRLHVPFTQMAPLFYEPVLQTPDGMPMPGGPLSWIWATQITTTDPFHAADNFHFQIVSGSGRRKDKQQQAQAATFLAQTLLPSIAQAASKTGDYTVVNRVLERLANALDMDLTLFRFPTPAEGEPYGHQVDSESHQTPGRPAGEGGTGGNDRPGVLPTGPSG